MTTIAIPGLLRRRRQAVGATWLRRLRTAAKRFWQALCALHGHEFLTHREPGRLYLECERCGRQTPGWLVGPYEVP